MASRRCLIVSAHFPPSTLAGVHRARHLARHLPDHGWEPTVICVDPRHHTERLDPDLRGLVPDDARVVETGALPVSLTAPFGVRGDVGLRALFHLRAAVEREMARDPARAVLITGSPFYPMLLAPGIRRRWQVPVVLDFQDPWGTRDGAQVGRWSKSRLSLRLAQALEPRALRGASWVTSVSDGQNAAMAARYPWFDGARMSAMPIGGDPGDYARLREMPPREVSVRLEQGRINLCYVGTFLPRAGSVVRSLFRGLARLGQTHPGHAARLRVTFVGTSNQPAGSAARQADHRVMPIAAEEGVAHLVREYPARVPYLEALSLLAHADGILMLGSDERHYTASKIYPALMSGRPWLSIFHEASSAHAILSAAGGGVALALPGEGQGDEALSNAVAEALVRLCDAPGSLGRADPQAYAPFTAAAIAGSYAALFETLAG